MTIPGVDNSTFKEEARKAGGEKKRAVIKNSDKGEKFCLSLSAFSINDQLEKLKAEEETAVFIIDKIAVLGEFTAISAPPNGGKTLLIFRGLVDAVKAGAVSGERIFYVNMDDNKRGAVCKAAIAREHGINMIVPVLADREATKGGKFSITEILNNKVEKDEVEGEIVILDTFKKFVNVMSKEDQSAFNGVLREFVTKGGTVIVLAHTNKNKNAEGDYVFNGTSDLPDDCDCAWVIHPTPAAGGTTHTFKFKKGRGVAGDDVAFFAPNVDDEPDDERYLKLFNGVTPCDPVTAEDEAAADWKDDLGKKYHVALAMVKEVLAEEGMKKHTELMGMREKYLRDDISRRKFVDLLKAFAGEQWTRERVGKEVFYSAIKRD